jgi:hypothetical protein
MFYKVPLSRGGALELCGCGGVLAGVQPSAYTTHPSAPLKRGFAQSLAF